MSRFWKPHRRDQGHFRRKLVERAEEFTGEDPRLCRLQRLDHRNLLTHERRPGRPVLIRFADQLEQDT